MAITAIMEKKMPAKTETTRKSPSMSRSKAFTTLPCFDSGSVSVRLFFLTPCLCQALPDFAEYPEGLL